jgi:hypothetical protein
MATPLKNYSDVVKKFLLNQIGTYDQDLRDEPVFDDEHKMYMLITKGSDGKGKRIYDILHSISINEEGKIVLEFNRSDSELEALLISAGVPQSDIVIDKDYYDFP